jgi:hypothetical protein
MLSLNKYPVPFDSVVSTVVDEQSTVLLKLDGTDFYTLNSTAARIWTLITGTKKISQVIDSLLQEYDASDTRIKESTVRQINTFLEEGLIYLSDKKVSSSKKKSGGKHA